MPKITVAQLHLLRAMYLLIAIGLILTAWPDILFPEQRQADSYSVISAFLGSLALLSILGLRYPVKMLPILFFELSWKVLWVILYGIPAWKSGSLNEYSGEVFFACLMGIVLTPIVIPWKYVFYHYFKYPGDAWLSSK